MNDPASFEPIAPTGRASALELADQLQLSLESPLIRIVLDSLDGYVAILNAQRQILAVNDSLLIGLGRPALENLLGKRPGEALVCSHAHEGEDGCGTGPACRQCGAVLTILAAQAQEDPATGECQLLMSRDGQLEAAEFSVKATPLNLNGYPFIVLVLHDISDQKRREVLESVFFHDVFNTLAGLRGWSELLSLGAESPQQAAQNILNLSDRLNEEVRYQRMLNLAERGELQLQREVLKVQEVFLELESVLRHHEIAKRHPLIFEAVHADQEVFCDRVLLQRILLNMCLNALEATPVGEQVRIGFRDKQGIARFEVSNPGVIPEDTARRLFHRSFSTKAGKGRGLGTYSMKLLGESYLGGRVGFSSQETEGTVFHLDLPCPNELQ